MHHPISKTKRSSSSALSLPIQRITVQASECTAQRGRKNAGRGVIGDEKEESAHTRRAMEVNNRESTICLNSRRTGSETAPVRLSSRVEQKKTNHQDQTLIRTSQGEEVEEKAKSKDCT
jgi:hypothetical protein